MNLISIQAFSLSLFFGYFWLSFYYSHHTSVISNVLYVWCMVLASQLFRTAKAGSSPKFDDFCFPRRYVDRLIFDIFVVIIQLLENSVRGFCVIFVFIVVWLVRVLFAVFFCAHSTCVCLRVKCFEWCTRCVD